MCSHTLLIYILIDTTRKRIISIFLFKGKQICFRLTPSKAEQLLQEMELHKIEEDKDEKYIGQLIKKNPKITAPPPSFHPLNFGLKKSFRSYVKGKYKFL